MEASLEMTQGTEEWLRLRKTKITATDVAVILGLNPYKSSQQLYHEKRSESIENKRNAAMQRGIDLEPIARELYEITVGVKVYPKVIIKDWAMASLDGMSEDGKKIVEIKCPGEKDHNLAKSGKIPEIYYPQCQFQMYCCDLLEEDYFSFGGFDGILIPVKFDPEFAATMIVKCLQFYQCLQNDQEV